MYTHCSCTLPCMNRNLRPSLESDYIGGRCQVGQDQPHTSTSSSSVLEEHCVFPSLRPHLRSRRPCPRAQTTAAPYSPETGSACPWLTPSTGRRAPCRRSAGSCPPLQTKASPGSPHAGIGGPLTPRSSRVCGLHSTPLSALRPWCRTVSSGSLGAGTPC